MRLTDILLITTAVAFLFAAIELVILIMLSKKTNAITELKAMMGRKTIGLFFKDDHRFEMKIVEPEGKLLEDKQYGSFVIDGQGAYLDMKTRNPILVFNPEIAGNFPVKAFKYAAALGKLINDDKALGQVRAKLASGEITKDQKIAVIRENVVFSELKKMLGVFSPHNITAEVNLKVARRTKDFGENALKYMMWLLIAGAVIIGAVLIGVYIIQNNPQIPGVSAAANSLKGIGGSIPT